MNDIDELGKSLPLSSIEEDETQRSVAHPSSQKESVWSISLRFASKDSIGRRLQSLIHKKGQKGFLIAGAIRAHATRQPP